RLPAGFERGLSALSQDRRAVRRRGGDRPGHAATRRAGVKLLRYADGWLGVAVLFVLGLADYWVQALAWPLQRGRDSWDYWLYFLQLLDRHPPFSQVMLFRTPVTPIVTGLPMLIGGGQFLEATMSVIYALSVLGWAWAVRPF